MLRVQDQNPRLDQLNGQFIFTELEAGDYQPHLLLADGPDEELDHGSSRETMELFYDGFNEYIKDLSETTNSVLMEKMSDEHRLVLGAARYVTSTIISRHGRPSHRLQIVDRVQNGNLALVIAAKKFDPERRSNIIGLIKPFLAKNILRYERGTTSKIDNGDLIRIPYRDKKGYYAVRNMLEGLAVKHGRHFEPEEVLQFENFDFTPATVKMYTDLRQEHVRFESVFNTETQNDITSEKPNDAHSVLEDSLPKEGISTVLNMLSDREAYVLSARNGLSGQEPQKLKVIAQELGITHQAVSKIEIKALTKLRAIPNIIDVINANDRPS